MRTTLDIDDSVMSELRARQRREGRTLGQVVSELLAHGLSDTAPAHPTAPLVWRTQPMGALVNLEDAEAVGAALDAGP